MSHAHGAPAPPVTGLQWLTKPVLFHSSRDYSKNYNYTRLTEYEGWLVTAPFHGWYRADYDFGRGTVYFFCISIFLMMIGHHVFKYRQRRAGLSKRDPKANKAIAAFRYLTSRQYHIPKFGYYTPPLGPMLLVASMVVFFVVLTFAPQPWYWPSPSLMGSSPPLGTRAGWISIGILPFLFMFGSKANLIGKVTGVSHEKLQVYHRWSAWIMYLTSLAHTFPFIVVHIGLGDMQLVWKEKTFYWSGVAALIPQTWLVLMSWGPIRSRYYETFKKVHFIATIIFFFFLFIHCNFRLSSWDYFVVTAVLYGASFFTRIFRALFGNGLGLRASFQSLPDRMIKITISTHLKWKPGQHYFIRFTGLGIHAFSSHPFTVTSLSEPTGVMELYIRQREGITSRLAAFAEGSAKESGVLVDGPYGGIEGTLRVYDRVVLVAGGSGVSFIIPLLLDLVRAYEEGLLCDFKTEGKDPGTHIHAQLVCKHIDVVWAVTAHEAISWVKDVFDDALKTLPEGFLNVRIHVTDSSRPSTPESGDIKELNAATALQTLTGRPELPVVIREACSGTGTVGIAVCGPDSLNLDVRNAVAKAQLDIVRGVSTCKEVYMHSESYSW